MHGNAQSASLFPDQSNHLKEKGGGKRRWGLSKRRRILVQACKGAYSVESLESRVLLAADFWTGASTANNNWTTGANWANGVAPRPGDDLVFPAGLTGAGQLNYNDFAGTQFQSIGLKGGGYTLDGNAIVLTNGIVSENAVGAANANTINLGVGGSGIILNASQTWVTVNGAGLYSQSAITTQNATLFVNSPIDTGSLLTLTVDGSGNTVFNGAISDSGSITKVGQGIAQLSGSNSYMGLTLVNGGVLEATTNTALAGTSAFMNQGAAIYFSGNLNNVVEPLAANGSGIGLGVDANGNGGAIRVVGGNYNLNTPASSAVSTVAINNNFALQANTSDFVGVDAGSTLTINGSVNSVQIGSGFLDKVGEGTLAFAGTASNTYTGSTNVLGGLLQLAKTSGAVAIAGNLVIGDPRNPIVGDSTTGAATTTTNMSTGATVANTGATVQLLANNQISPVDFWAVNLLSVTLFPSGKLDLNGFSNTVGNVNLDNGPAYSPVISTASDTGAALLTGQTVGGLLQLEGTSITVTDLNGTSAATPAAVIAGNLDLSSLFSGGETVSNGAGVYHQINVPQQALPDYEVAGLNITANISGTAAYGLEKIGAGDLQLSGNNTYAGPTVLNNGLTDVASNTAFGNGVGMVEFQNNNPSIRAVGGAVSLANPVEMDGSSQLIFFLGANHLTFTSTLR